MTQDPAPNKYPWLCRHAHRNNPEENECPGCGEAKGHPDETKLVAILENMQSIVFVTDAKLEGGFPTSWLWIIMIFAALTAAFADANMPAPGLAAILAWIGIPLFMRLDRRHVKTTHNSIAIPTEVMIYEVPVNMPINGNKLPDPAVVSALGYRRTDPFAATTQPLPAVPPLPGTT